ncbi:MAG: hypothetical protein ABJF10_14200 [Chthoniobacter sp.]|uniref:hypothetical protein n=1 Tax=Chthoniobacter sp. TaxID=2510640 RepID=UPI0032A3A99C
MLISRFSSVALAALLLTVASAAGADPVTELAAVSTFKSVDLDKLAGGAMQIARGPAMNFPRGLAVESVYVLRTPVPKALELHEQWNPNKHPELKVYLHGELSAKPTLAEYQKLAAAPGNASVKAFAAATQKLGSGATTLQMSNADVKAFGSQAAPATGGGALPPKVASFWSSLLQQRTQAFLSGGASRLPPYETSGETIRLSDEIAHLLKDAPKVRSQFGALIEANPLTGSKTAQPQSAYWEMFDVEGLAAVNLGALFVRTSGDTCQVVDGQFYASGGYYALLTFYQMWPVKIGGKDCTLVWRTDLISAAELATLHGVERMGSSTAMMRETKKSIESLLKDAGQNP